MYHIIADLHTHSIASDHAYSTIAEMMQSARDKGLFALAVTDHNGEMPGAPTAWYFNSLASTVPLYYKDVLFLAGMEANVVDLDGTLDLVPEVGKRLNWGIASIHDIGYAGLQNPTVEACTNLWMNVAGNPYIHVIGHSGDPKFAYDYETVIPEFGRQGKLVEINAHSFAVRPQNNENCRKIAQACMKHGVSIVVNSDAHIETEVANLEPALHMLEEIGFPEALILNASKERLTDYLHKHTKTFSRG